MAELPQDEQPLDYAGREVCADCHHTHLLHQGSVCAAMHCYCTGYVSAIVKRVRGLVQK
jgi:hypothetical protein